MPRDSKTNSSHHALAELRRRHADRSQSSRFHHILKSEPKHKTSKSFHHPADHVTPAAFRSTFRSLYTFFFLEMSLLIVWVAYRAFVREQPLWFDEGIAKAIVFGLPVFWFSARSRFIGNEMGLNLQQLVPGLYMGLAIGGLYGFVGILSQVMGGREVVEANLFASPTFWWYGAMALLTAWWESLFFFGLPVQYLRSIASWLSESLVGGFVVVLFLLFHSPLRLMLAGGSSQFVLQLATLGIFAIGQYILYTRTKNMYALVLSHALWGLVIQVYAR
jgi:hypothetical protein